MKTQELITKFKEIMKLNGHTLTYFIEHYLPHISIKYAAIHKQINGYTALSEEVQAAIVRYVDYARLVRNLQNPTD